MFKKLLTACSVLLLVLGATAGVYEVGDEVMAEWGVTEPLPTSGRPYTLVGKITFDPVYWGVTQLSQTMMVYNEVYEGNSILFKTLPREVLEVDVPFADATFVALTPSPVVDGERVSVSPTVGHFIAYDNQGRAFNMKLSLDVEETTIKPKEMPEFGVYFRFGSGSGSAGGK